MSKLYVNEVHSKTGSTKALEIDSNGIISQSNPVGFRCKMLASQSVSANNTRLIGWTISSSKIAGGFNTDGASGTVLNLSTGVVTIPVSGYYSWTVDIRLDSFSGSYSYIDFWQTDSSGNKTGTQGQYRYGRSLQQSHSSYDALTMSGVSYFNANTHAALFWANSGDNNVEFNDDTYWSLFKVA